MVLAGYHWHNLVVHINISVYSASPQLSDKTKIEEEGANWLLGVHNSTSLWHAKSYLYHIYNSLSTARCKRWLMQYGMISALCMPKIVGDTLATYSAYLDTCQLLDMSPVSLLYSFAIPHILIMWHTISLWPSLYPTFILAFPMYLWFNLIM